MVNGAAIELMILASQPTQNALAEFLTTIEEQRLKPGFSVAQTHMKTVLGKNVVCFVCREQLDECACQKVIANAPG